MKTQRCGYCKQLKELTEFRYFEHTKDKHTICKTCQDKIRRRNKTIVKQVLAGKSLEEVGKHYQITRERVRQIVANSKERQHE